MHTCRKSSPAEPRGAAARNAHFWTPKLQKFREPPNGFALLFNLEEIAPLRGGGSGTSAARSSPEKSSGQIGADPGRSGQIGADWGRSGQSGQTLPGQQDAPHLFKAPLILGRGKFVFSRSTSERRCAARKADGGGAPPLHSPPHL